MEHFRKGRPLTEAGKKQLTKIKLREGQCQNCKFSEMNHEGSDAGHDEVHFFCLNAPNEKWLEVRGDDWCLFWEEDDRISLEQTRAYNETRQQVKQYMSGRR